MSERHDYRRISDRDYAIGCLVISLLMLGLAVLFVYMVTNA